MEFYECCPIRHNGIKVLDNVLFRLDREDKVVFMGDEIAVTILFNILIVEEEIDASFKNGILVVTAPKKKEIETKRTISIKDSK